MSLPWSIVVLCCAALSCVGFGEEAKKQAVVLSIAAGIGSS
jgi:hypothetical protein